MNHVACKLTAGATGGNNKPPEHGTAHCTLDALSYNKQNFCIADCQYIRKYLHMFHLLWGERLGPREDY